MLHVVKWTFGSKPMKSTDIITKKFCLGMGFYKGLQFGISGLGLTKLERELFDTKFLEFTGIITLYLGKLVITYNRNGSYAQMKNVDIYYDKPLFQALKEKLQTKRSE